MTTADATRRRSWIDWARQGGDLLLARVADMSDAELAAPSPLPGWTCGHVGGPVALTAAAAARLLQGPRTGVETPMYDGPDARDEESRLHARLQPAALRRLLTDEEN